MSGAAVIVVRIRRVFSFLRERQAVSPGSAIPESDVPYSQKWYYERLVAYGAIKRIADRCYLDETLAQSYLRDWRRRGLKFIAGAIAAFCVLWLIWTLI